MGDAADPKRLTLRARETVEIHHQTARQHQKALLQHLFCLLSENV